MHILIIVAIFATIGAKAQVSFGESSLFNEGWKFILSDMGSEEASCPNFDDSLWEDVSLPHDWSVKGKLSPDNASCMGYLPTGIGWYRKHFSANQFCADSVFVYFEGVYNRSAVYLNGHLLGYRPSGYNSFMYEMTPFLNRGGDNVLAVKVDHSRNADSRWYTGSGIYRNVWVIQAGSIHFAQWGVGYEAVEVSDNHAIIRVDTAIEGLKETPAIVEISLKDACGRVVATSEEKAGRSNVFGIRLADPHVWDIVEPYLYTLEASIKSDGKLLDRTEIPVGIRTLAFSPDQGFSLNGRNIKVKGVCLHHDAGVLGTAVPDKFVETRLRVLKSIGANAIRTSHNPQAPIFYELCDRLGLLVIDEGFDEWEFNKKKWVKGWNVGIPAMDGTADYFNEWGERDIADMVRRDRNHPSIFLWSIGNEVDYPNDPYSHPILDGDGIDFNQPMSGGYMPDAPDAMRIGEIAERLSSSVRSIDRSRPVTGALAGVVMSNQTGYPDAIDVVGYNYTESRYLKDHERYPERIIYGSENGAGYGAWKAVRDNDFIFGQFIWTGTDYLGESGVWPSRGFYSGLLSFDNRIKPRGRFRAALWCETPVCYIGTYPKSEKASDDTIDAWDSWDYEDGEMIHVVCYTNAAKARLLLNGKVVGKKKPYNAETGIIAWDIPFSSGSLMAEGYDENGKKTCEYEICSSSKPAALLAKTDDTEVKVSDLIQIDVEIVDDKGNPVRMSDNLITCSVEGPARLLGLESGSNTDMSDCSSNARRAFRGHITAYLEAGMEPGRITVSFSSPIDNSILSTESHIISHTTFPRADTLPALLPPAGQQPQIHLPTGSASGGSLRHISPEGGAIFPRLPANYATERSVGQSPLEGEFAVAAY